MFFSSPDYTEPDVVVVYGNTHTMSTGSGDATIHSEISYRNMTFSQDTVLVLMDVTKELLKQGVRTVNEARPVDQLLALRRIPGGASNFTCLRQQNNG